MLAPPATPKVEIRKRRRVAFTGMPYPSIIDRMASRPSLGRARRRPRTIRAPVRSIDLRRGSRFQVVLHLLADDQHVIADGPLHRGQVAGVDGGEDQPVALGEL